MTQPPDGRAWRILVPLVVLSAVSSACGGRADRANGAGDTSSDGTGGLSGPVGTSGAPSEPEAPTFSTIVAGSDHFCGITREDRRLLCMSDGQVLSDEQGPFRAFDMNEDVATWRYRCTVHESGELSCSGLPDVAVPEGWFLDVSVGAFNACARRESGELECWIPEQLGGLGTIPDIGESYSVDSGSVCTRKSQIDSACYDQNGNKLLPDDGSGHFLGGLFLSVKAAPRAGCAAILVAIPDMDYEEFGEVLNRNNIACFSADGARSKIDGLFNVFDVNVNEDGCAIDSGNGLVACWGAFDGSVPDDLTGSFAQVSVSTGLACVLNDAGAVRCWPPIR